MRISKKKTSSLLRAASGFLLKKNKLDYFPLRLWIETSSRCNLSCGLCANKDLAPNQKGDMEMSLFEKIIDEAKGLALDVNLFHRGEPLLNENIFAMISYAKKAGLYTRLHSNATLLSKKLSRKLLCCGLDYLSFSFDGYQKQTYEANRTGADFEKTLHNIYSFLRIRKEGGYKKPYTLLQVMEHDQDLGPSDFKRQRKEFQKTFMDLGLDQLRIRRPHNWGGLIKEVDAGQRRGSSACTFCWYSLTILYDGKVCLCPQDFEAKILIGDVRKASIQKIFNAKEIREFREKNKNGQIEKIIPCRNCDRIHRKTLMGVPLEYLKAFLSGK